MKILLAHNYYQLPGGEDVVFKQERQLLERMGHRVITYTRSNLEIASAGKVRRAGLLKTIVYAHDSRDHVAGILERERPDVVHVHNTLMMISPSIFSVCWEYGIPTVQTLHNYRLICPGVTLYRQGRVCEDCTQKSMIHAVRHRCYRDSSVATGAVVTMLKYHEAAGTWANKVSAYIALTEFAKRKFAANGLPAGRIHVKPNFVDPDPGPSQHSGEYFLFVGRLSEEKGVKVLLEAWEGMTQQIALRIVGDGPLRADVEEWIRQHHGANVTYLAQCSRSETIALMKNARAVIVPSLWYEGFPMVLVESFACGVPVIGSRLGALEELIDDGINGMHFDHGDAGELGKAIQWAWANPATIRSMGRMARLKYEQEYSTAANYRQLLAIYQSVLHRA
jgi:glycosyltransferase involved in cell wall biosynthesis